MLKLKALRHDKFLARLYVEDQNGKLLVVVDRGEYYSNTGQIRFRVYECNSRGELLQKVTEAWELVEGVEGSDFPSGLAQSAELQRRA